MTEYEQAQARVQSCYPGALVKPIGSTHIVGHGKDMDFIVLVPELITGRDQGRDHGFVWADDSSEIKHMSGEDDGWCSGRLLDVNVILTDSPLFFLGQALTADIAKLVQGHTPVFTDKEDRIKAHRLADKLIAEIERHGS